MSPTLSGVHVRGVRIREHPPLINVVVEDVVQDVVQDVVVQEDVVPGD